MAPQFPVIFLAFANQHPKPLEYLTLERKNIKDALTPLELQGKLLIKEEAATNLKDIFKTFNNYRGRLSILHYGGHANEQLLDLQDDPLEGKTLAELISIGIRESKQELALVFLNGCATRGQVDILLEAGVKCVIATETVIGDSTASKFANEFYKALASGTSLQGAFDTASAFVKNNATGKYESQPHRPLNSVTRRSKRFTWDIYAKNNKDKEWKLVEIPVAAQSGRAIAIDFAVLDQKLDEVNYVEVIQVLEEYFKDRPNYQFSQLRITILHYLNQGLMPPHATVQGLKIFINNLRKKLSN